MFNTPKSSHQPVIWILVIDISMLSRVILMLKFLLGASSKSDGQLLQEFWVPQFKDGLHVIFILFWFFINFCGHKNLQWKSNWRKMSNEHWKKPRCSLKKKRYRRVVHYELKYLMGKKAGQEDEHKGPIIQIINGQPTLSFRKWNQNSVGMWTLIEKMTIENWMKQVSILQTFDTPSNR